MGGGQRAPRRLLPRVSGRRRLGGEAAREEGHGGQEDEEHDGQAPLDREEEARAHGHGEDAVDGLRHVVGEGALDPLEVGREPGQEVAGPRARVEADGEALEVREHAEAQVAHHARHHPRDQVVVGEVAEPVEEEEPHHRPDQRRGQGRVAGHDGVVQQRPQQEGLERDERGGRRLREDDEERLPPVGPQIAGRRPQEIQHGGRS